jgi:diguanylate cyclase (GGDEF)-like protein/PAS domain S-box-containing protein
MTKQAFEDRRGMNDGSKRQRWAFVPASRRLFLIIWPFLAIVVLLVGLSLVMVDVLSAGRAYVEGESRWSKGQKEAVFHLLRYAETLSEADYRRYQEAVKTPVELNAARVEMEKPSPDYPRLRQHLLDGGDHPDDIDGIIRLYRNFRHVPYIDRVIGIWEQGDRYIVELVSAAEYLHVRIQAGDTSAKSLGPAVAQIRAINARLTPMEHEFSYVLGDANRTTKLLLLIFTFAIPGTLVPLGILFSHRMVRRSQAFENALRLSEERFQLAVSGSNDGIWDWNLLTSDIYFSPRFKELLGYASDELEDNLSTFVLHLHPEDRRVVRTALRAHLSRGEVYDVEYRCETKGGEYRWFRARGQSVRNAAGQAVRMAGSMTDITDRKQAEAQLFAEKERAQVTLQSIGDAVITTDTLGYVEYINPAAETLTGWTVTEARGRPLKAVCSLLEESTRRPARDPIQAVLKEGCTMEKTSNAVVVRRDGAEIAVDESAAPIRDRAGNIAGVVLVFHDVSRERAYAAKLSYQATHDELTGLINRREFERRLTLALQSTTVLRRHHAVMYLDLDQFKVVNDTCGHAAGDELMRQVTALLQRRLREGDTLARLGGDEFGVLLENCPPEPAHRIAEELRQAVNDCPFLWHSRSFSVGISIGLVNLSEGPFTLADVLSAADTACYMAKEKGRNRLQIYRPDDSELSLRQGEMEWVGRIHRAHDEGRLRLYAQEIFQVQEQHRSGMHVELLIRMVDERGELVPPMAFLPAAERYNLMPMIDRWVIRAAFGILAQMRMDGRELIELCAINLSGASIGDERFLDFIREQFAQRGIPHGSICFEITETAAIANLAKAAYFIQELRSLGCLFSLDDFGAGMSSFSYLKHLPVDFLKIDGGFVKDMLIDPIDRAMVVAINDIGHVMEKQTIAEFVEDHQVLAMLREIGVDYAQGYGLAKPRPFGPDLVATPPPPSVPARVVSLESALRARVADNKKTASSS